MSMWDNITPEQFAKMIRDNSGGGSSGGTGVGSAPKSGMSAEEAAKSFTQQAKDMSKNLSRMNSSILPTASNLQKASKAQGQFNSDLSRVTDRLDELNQALDPTREGFDKLSDATKASLEQEKKFLQESKKTLDFEKTKQDVTVSATNAANKYAEIYGQYAAAQLQGASSILSAVQQGGSGFQVFGAAANYAAEMANMQAQIGAKAAGQAGASLTALGGKAAIAGGAISFLASMASNAAELQKQATKIQNDLLAAEGERLASGFHEAAQAGAMFADGADGMIRATKDSRITFKDLADVVKENRDALGRSGIGVSGAVEQIGRVGASMKKSGLDQQLLGLGYSYKEQAGLMADVMADTAKMSGGAPQDDAAIQASTKAYAENLSMISAITGQDAKKKMEEARESANNLAFQNKLQNMSVQDQKNIQAQMANMTAQQKKDFMETMVFGRIVNKTGAVMASQIPAYAEGVKKSVDVANAHYASEAEAQKAQEEVQAKMNKGMNDYVKSGQGQAMGKAGAAGNAMANEVGAATLEMQKNSRQYGAASKERTALEQRMAEEAKKGKKGSVDEALKTAASTVNDFQMKLQEFVTGPDGLTKMVAAQKGALESLLNSYKGLIPGSPMAGTWMEKLGDFFAKYGMALQALVTVLPLVTGGFKLLGGGAKGAGEALENAAGKNKGKLTSSVDKNGKTFYHEEGNKMARASEADFKAQNSKTGKFKSYAKGVGGGVGIGLIGNLAGAGMDMLGDKLKESGHEDAGGAMKVGAKAAEFAATGAMIGSIIPGLGTAAGAVIGGVIGGGMGMYEQFGDQMAGWAEKSWEYLKEVPSKFLDMVNAIPKILIDGLTTTVNTIGTAFTSVADSVKGFFSSIPETIDKVFGGVVTSIKEVGATVFEFIKTGTSAVLSPIVGIFNQVVSAFTSIKESISNLLGSIGEKIKGMVPSWLGGSSDEKKAEAKPVETAKASAAGNTSAANIAAQVTAPKPGGATPGAGTSAGSAAAAQPAAKTEDNKYTINGKPASKAEYDAYQKQQAAAQAAAKKDAVTDPSKLSNDTVALTKQMVNLLERISRSTGDTRDGIQRIARAAT